MPFSGITAKTYIAQYERKIAELERKVGQLTMEVDLLKGTQGRQPNEGSYSIVSGPKPSPSRGDAES
jgi:transposase